MGTYQILFHGYGFEVSLDGEEHSISGFYTARRVQADGPDNAYLSALKLLKSEEKTKLLMAESISKGRHPRFEAEEIFEVSFWSRLFGKYPKGFVFYDNTDERDGNQTSDPSEPTEDGNHPQAK